MQNIILIGMPGCGKSTIAQALAQQLDKNFADSDVLVEEMAQKSIPCIFAEDGEAAFRHWETMALTELGKRSGTVIATGGGCVTQKRNYAPLHQNGSIFYLQRDLDQLATHGRPLSQSRSLATIFEERAAEYSQFADHIISNNGTLQDAVNTIMEVLK